MTAQLSEIQLQETELRNDLSHFHYICLSLSLSVGMTAKCNQMEQHIFYYFLPTFLTVQIGWVIS